MLVRSSSVATAAIIAAFGCFAPFSALTEVRAQGPSINVVNPSFETDGDFGAYPGYVAGNHAVTGWTDTNDGRTGVNNVSQPFAGGTNIPDYTHVGFIQENASTGTLSQTISGLVPGEQYWFQVFYGERQDNGTPVLNVT